MIILSIEFFLCYAIILLWALIMHILDCPLHLQFINLFEHPERVGRIAVDGGTVDDVADLLH